MSDEDDLDERCGCLRIKQKQYVLRRFDEVASQLESYCDSFALYRLRELAWLACADLRRPWVVVRDTSLLPELEAMGLPASEKMTSAWTRAYRAWLQQTH